MTDPLRGRSSDGEEELRDEVEFYLEERARELRAQGMEPDEARREARRRFGDVEEVVAEMRRIERGRRWGEGMRRVLEGFVRDARHAGRLLVRSPGFAVVTVLTLALGIGAVTAIFSVVNASLLRTLPFEDAEEVVFLQGAYAAPEGPAIRGASVPEARDWEALSRSFAEVSVADGTSFTLTGSGGPAEVVPAERVDEGYFELFGVDALLGRTFTEEEYRVPGTHFVAMLGHGLWTRRFGGDPGIVGESIELSGQAWTVVGVLPEGFQGATLNADLLVPLATMGAETLDARGSRFLGVAARLAPGVTVEQAQADMDAVAARLEAEYPDAHEDRIALVTPARDVYLGSTKTLMLLVLAASVLLLLIAAANLVNLLLVRATAREGEVVVRRAIGAGRARLVRQFVTESLVLSALGAGLGLLLGLWGAQAFAAAMPQALLPAFVEVRPDVTVFAVVTVLMTLVGIGAGLAPGILAAREDVATALRVAGRGGGRSSRLQAGFVVAEVALALLLLVGAGLMIRSFRAQLAVDPGYDHASLYGFQLFLPSERYESERLLPVVRDLRDRLEARPDVAAAAVMSDIPLRSGYSAAYLWLAHATGDDDRIRFYLHRVGTDWFSTMGTRVLSGRGIEARDVENDRRVAVISEALADRFYPGEDPLGRTIHLGSRDNDAFVIVGVAEDVRYRDLTTDIRGGADDPDVYVPWGRFPSRAFGIVLRPRAGDPAGLARVARDVVAELDPMLALTGTGPLADDLRAQTAQARFGTLLLSGFGILAAGLAVIGLYGVLAFAVGRRRREIALRMALGARATQVRRMVVGQGMALAGSGLVLGIAAALLASRTLEAFLFGVRPLDPATFVVAAAAMAAVAALAALVPAARATRVEPQGALREE